MPCPWPPRGPPHRSAAHQRTSIHDQTDGSGRPFTERTARKDHRRPKWSRLRSALTRHCGWTAYHMHMHTPRERVVVIGGSRGIGLELVKQYVKRDIEVHTTYRTYPPAALQLLAGAHGNVYLHALDVCNCTQVAQLASDLSNLSVSILIHSAGVIQGSVLEQLAINAEAPFAVIAALMPAVLRGGKRRICILTSDLGSPIMAQRYQDSPRLGAYSQSKLAANNRFRELEPAWRRQGVTAVAMQPGFVSTEMNGGQGRITPEQSAQSVVSVLDGLTSNAAGTFVDYKRRTLSWQTGQPARQRQLRPHQATVRRPHLGAQDAQVTQARGGAAWAPLEGRSVAELLAQHPDPLRALSRGEVPAVILRGVLGPTERQALLTRLVGKGAAAGKYWTRSLTKTAPQRPLYADIGANLASHLNKGRPPAEYTRAVAHFLGLYERLGLLHPVRILHESLRAIAAGRTVATGVDVATNRSFGPGIFRQTMNGGTFPIHFDSLRAHIVGARSCDGTSAASLASMQQASSASAYSDIYRFEQQLAALINLQQPGGQRGGELSTFDYDRHHVLKDCSLAVNSSAHNVFLANDTALQNRLSQRRSSQPRIEPGDFYVINVNRLHVVHPVHGTDPRVSLGSFVGYSSSELRVWS